LETHANNGEPICMVIRVSIRVLSAIKALSHLAIFLVTTINEHQPLELDPNFTVDESLLEGFRELWKEADSIWDKNQNHPGFHAYVSADYMDVVRALAELRQQAFTFVEWGSGLGVVTIMASQMGFDAYGIEAEPALVEHSESLAEKWGPDAQFVTGSFIPDDFEWNPAEGDEAVRTIIDVPAAYEELEMEIRDFDLIYSYPWPTEHALYHNVMREFAHSRSMLLTYDAREGIGIVRRSDLGTD